MVNENFCPLDFDLDQLVTGTKIESKGSASLRLAQHKAMVNLTLNPNYYAKGAGTCKQGERADLTGCTPATNDPNKKKETGGDSEGMKEDLQGQITGFRDLRLWVDNDIRLYELWGESGLEQGEFIQKYKDKINQVINLTAKERKVWDRDGVLPDKPGSTPGPHPSVNLNPSEYSNKVEYMDAIYGIAADQAADLGLKSKDEDAYIEAAMKAGREKWDREKEGKEPVDPKKLFQESDHKAINKTLVTSPVKEKKPLGGGANVSEVLILEDGTKGVWKPSSGEDKNLRDYIEAGTYWRREVATSRVADALGFGDLVPVTTVREQDGDKGSIQAFAENSTVANGVRGREWDGPTDSMRSAVFDFIIGQTDRHHGNWMIKKTEAGDKIVLIDNGLTFPFDKETGGNTEFEDYVTDPIPDFSAMKDKWPVAEKALQEMEIEPEAIALTKKRFDYVINGKGKILATLRRRFNQEDE